jgi:hypothetical protein
MLCALAGSSLGAQPALNEARQITSKLLQMVNLSVKMAVWAANGELLVPNRFPPQLRQAQVQTILNFLAGRSAPEFKELSAAIPVPVATPKDWDGVGMLSMAEVLHSKTKEAGDRGEFPAGVARAVDAAVQEVLRSLRRAIEISKVVTAITPATAESEARIKEFAFELKLLLIVARGSREDPLLEGGLRSILRDLPPR